MYYVSRKIRCKIKASNRKYKASQRMMCVGWLCIK